jgi:NAD(P)-dependent dehydrogenase (short-subunit alcohol dehydrogenase family)
MTRTAVVTGVTSGIGAALARRLIAGGSRVAGIGRDREKLAAACEAAGGKLVPIFADLSDADSRAGALTELREKVDGIDVLVLNAAEVVYETPSALPPARWRRLLEVNLLAGIELVHGVVDRMPRGGHVVAVSSAVARFLPSAPFGPYAVTKAALEGWAAALRLEVQALGLRVTVIAPGLVDTPIYDKVAGFEGMRDKLRHQIPVWLAADDVVDAVDWVLARPPHVTVSEIVLLPAGQGR